jgi:penicillin-binding protein 1C
VLATRFWTAVKTGTSKDMRDNWALGWSQRYTVGVWVGNASGAAMHDVSGTSGAAPIWAAVMQQLHARTPSRAPLPPAGLTRSACASARSSKPPQRVVPAGHGTGKLRYQLHS